MPEEYGGAGLGITEASVMMQAIAESGAAFSGASAVHLNIFGLNPVVVAGTEEQKARMLPPLIRGENRACFAVTEPNAGLDTTNITTTATRTNSGYVVNGRKIWTSTAQTADKVLLLARTSPKPANGKRVEGLTLFYTDFDRDHVEAREIEKMGRKAVDSNAVFIDGLPVPEEDRIGEEGKGFYYLLHGLNPERILVAVEAVGIARAAIRRACEYAGEREVFGRPIGQNQAIAHPLARAWAEVEAANLMAYRARRPLRRGRGVRRRVERGQVPRGRSRLPRLRDGGDVPRGDGLREGVPRRALSPGGDDRAHRPGEPGDDPQLHRRAGPRPAPLLLTGRPRPPIEWGRRGAVPDPEQDHCHRSSGVHSAMLAKSRSVDSITSPWAMQSWASKASMVPA